MSHEKFAEELNVTGVEDVESDSEEDDNFIDGDEVEEDEDMIMERAKCLFCADDFSSAEEVFTHCNSVHGFNVVSVTKQHHLDFYNYVKMINFIRKVTPPQSTLTTHYPHLQCPWSTEDFLMPVVKDDPLLCFDVECDLERILPDLVKKPQSGNSQNKSKNKPQQNITLTFDEYNQLLSDLETSKKQNSIYSNQLEHALADLNNLRSSSITQSNINIVDWGHNSNDNNNNNNIINNSNNNNNNNNNNSNNNNNNSNNNNSNNNDDVRRLEDDDYYFQSYDHYGIHEEMLKDTVRTLSYQEAIKENAGVIKDKKVLDLGCGTSILSMFMAQAGAESVYAVDQSDVVYKAMEIVRENGMEGVISCIKGRIEDVSLPSPQVDVIVSEWMGYFLLFESMLESVLWARDHVLKKGGVLMPDKCKIMLGAFEDDQMRQSRIAYWDEVYAFRMTTMRDSVLCEAQLDVVKESSIVTNEDCIFDLNLMTCSRRDIDSTHNFTLYPSRDASLTGFYAYFTTTFDLPHKVILTTSPQTTPTHWKQTLFLLGKPVTVKKDEPLQGTISWRRNVKDTRSFIISITLSGRQHKYYLS